MALELLSVLKSVVAGNSTMFASILTWALYAFVMFGGILPFIPQYLDIKWTNNADGFSTFVCLTLIAANTLRILFWWGHPFEVQLLVQSFVMLGAMFTMMQLCTSVKIRNEIISSRLRSFSVASQTAHSMAAPQPTRVARFSDLDGRYFWRWTHFSSYVQCSALFALVAGFITYLLQNVAVYVETLGYLALLCEAMLGSPQFIQNIRNQATTGMSIKMVLLWTCGDIFKTVYFIVRNAPFQFWVCGMLQVGLDYAILFQVFYYSPAKSA